MYVRQFMTKEVISVSPNDNIADTMALMRDKKISRLPVVEHNALVGLVTDGDLREVSPSPATTLSIFELNYLVAKTPIKEVAIKKVITCAPDTLIEDAALLMRDNEIGGLPVVEGGKLVGIITESDIFDAFLDIMGFRSQGERVVIEASDKVGVLEDLAVTFREYEVNVSSFAVYHRETENVQIVSRLSGAKVAEAIKAIRSKGYDVK